MKKLILLTFFTSFLFAQNDKKLIKVTYDKFDKCKTYDAEAGALGIFFTQYDIDTDFRFKRLTVTVYDSYLTYASDLTLLFSDNTNMKFETDEELGKSSSKGYRYLSFISPTDEQWQILKSKEIIGFKYHIFERNYTQGKKFINILNEVLK